VDGQPSCEEEGELRNMILAMVDEPLAILIKLADRLHNMRTVLNANTGDNQCIAKQIVTSGSPTNDGYQQ
jgi:(p)ppGpp synthase/HD superfamily hydrolase